MAKRNRIVIDGDRDGNHIVKVNGQQLEGVDFAEMRREVCYDGRVEVILHLYGSVEVTDNADVERV